MTTGLGPRLRPLRQLLAKVYPSERDLKRVLSDIGVDSYKIPSGIATLTLWHEALELVLDHNLLPALVQTASEDAPTHAGELHALLADIEPHLRGSRSPERLEQLAKEGSSATAEVLNWPSTLPSGVALDRPERHTIEQHLQNAEISVTVVLGEAGCGKSALLATVGNALQRAGERVLGVRLDRLAKDVTTAEQFQRYLGFSEPLVDTVEALASQGPVTVIIDQLDALCDLMTERAGRLALILETIESLAEIKDVHVILACRPFEFQHDVRLRQVRAEEVTLALPPWTDIEPHVVRAQVEPAQLQAELREELRKPQALRTFLELIGQGQDWRQLPTYHAMRERLWEFHITQAKDGARRRALLYDLARWMAKEEVLTRPLAQMDDWRSEVGVMESVGWLQRVGLAANAGVTFRHQSLFDFAFARAVVAEGGSLLEQVIDHQGLFIRRRVWSVLAYLREASAEQYLREIDRLWREPALRQHLKRLLIDFIGQLSRPLPREVDMLRGAIDDPLWRTYAFSAVGRRPQGWFEHLHERELPRAMTEPAIAGTCVSILAAAPVDHTDRVLDLLEEHWLGNRAGALWSLLVVMTFKAWSERALGFAERLAGQVPLSDNHRLEQLVLAILPTSSERAAAVFAKALESYVTSLLKEFHSKPEPDRPGESDDVAKHVEWHRAVDGRYDPIRNLFEGNVFWTQLSELVDAAPSTFLHAVWPSMIRAINAIGHSTSIFPVFRRELMWIEGANDSEHNLISHIRNAVTRLARAEPDAFVDFLRREGEHDLMSVHVLLLQGLTEVAASRPNAVLEYFGGDRRRMSIDLALGEGDGTLECLAKVSSQLEATIQQRLAEILGRWKPADSIPTNWSARERWNYLQYVRRRRLRLLLCLDIDKLTTSTRARVEEELRVFPVNRSVKKNAKRGARRTRVAAGTITSRMQAPHMEKASDKDIIDFLLELSDETNWEHPRHWLEGGSIEASRELAKLTENNPERGLRIARTLPPGTHQRPVSMVIEAAANAGFGADRIFEIIIECEERGFCTAFYRSSVAHGLEAIATREGQNGLPTSMCELMRSWLIDADGSDGADKDMDEDESRDARCIMFSGGLGHVLPGGNYPILSAISAGLLNRTNADFDLWLTILEEHVRRRERPRVWQALAYNELRHLYRADRSRAAALLMSIFERFPALLDVKQGLHLLDHHQNWMPEAIVHQWLEILRGRNTRWHSQAYGELLVLRAYRVPEDAWAITEIEQLVRLSNATDESVIATRSGIALMSALAFREEILVDRAGAWLVSLAETEHPAISTALTDLFAYNDPPPYSSQIDTLLATLETHPYHLRQGKNLNGLLHALHQYLKRIPERVIKVANEIIDVFEQEAARYASDLVDLSLTLQDTPGQLEGGLDLFERLQGLGLYEVEQVLNEREAQPGTPTMTLPRPRRPRRGRR